MIYGICISVYCDQEFNRSVKYAYWCVTMLAIMQYSNEWLLQGEKGDKGERGFMVRFCVVYPNLNLSVTDPKCPSWSSISKLHLSHVTTKIAYIPTCIYQHANVFYVDNLQSRITVFMSQSHQSLAAVSAFFSRCGDSGEP